MDSTPPRATGGVGREFRTGAAAPDHRALPGRGPAAHQEREHVRDTHYIYYSRVQATLFTRFAKSIGGSVRACVSDPTMID